jgi:hypothetical protein
MDINVAQRHNLVNTPHGSLSHVTFGTHYVLWPSPLKHTHFVLDVVSLLPDISPRIPNQVPEGTTKESEYRG